VTPGRDGKQKEGIAGAGGNPISKGAAEGVNETDTVKKKIRLGFIRNAKGGLRGFREGLLCCDSMGPKKFKRVQIRSPPWAIGSEERGERVWPFHPS